MIDAPASPEKRRTLAVLGYHKVGVPSPGAWPTWFYVPEETFAAHLHYLRDAGWQVIGVETLLRGILEPQTLPARAALITFDDGYRSVLDVAVPYLVECGFPAVQFVPTDYIGGRNLFDGGDEPEESICDWDELRELERRNVSVQAHSASHRHFSSLSPADRERELHHPKNVLEARLGRPVELFSFPYGDAGTHPEVTEAALKLAGYKAAFLYGGGPVQWPAPSPYLLSRVAVGPDTDLARVLASSGQTPEAM